MAFLLVEILIGEGNSSRDLSESLHWPVFYLRVHMLSFFRCFFMCETQSSCCFLCCPFRLHTTSEVLLSRRNRLVSCKCVSGWWSQPEEWLSCLLGRNVSYKDIDFQFLFWGRKNKEYSVYESHFWVLEKMIISEKKQNLGKYIYGWIRTSCNFWTVIFF